MPMPRPPEVCAALHHLGACDQLAQLPGQRETQMHDGADRIGDGLFEEHAAFGQIARAAEIHFVTAHFLHPQIDGDTQLSAALARVERRACSRRSDAPPDGVWSLRDVRACVSRVWVIHE